jgi:hypothetical protein
VNVSTISTNPRTPASSMAPAAEYSPPLAGPAICTATPFAVTLSSVPVCSAKAAALAGLMPTSSRTRVVSPSATGAFASSRR